MMVMAIRSQVHKDKDDGCESLFLSLEYLRYPLFIIYLSLDLPLLKHKSGLDHKYSY
jgi:hypothetical protein